ncbi:hypothetical protein [Kitasatospora sp. McL0602]|uniref:hypothetical protein n=1 Tax=Kitasatospora sp. McL0602 TaxID=3439530 RepID=UPI003F8A34F8
MRRTAAVALTLLALAGCGSTATPQGPTPSGVTASGGTSAPAVVTLDEHADRTTVDVAVGTVVRIDLHSTYWSGVTSSAPQLLQPVGAPSTSPSPGCHPGGGCGTVSSAFRAAAPGPAQLTAERTSCGEARPCAADQRTFTVTVRVTG